MSGHESLYFNSWPVCFAPVEGRFVLFDPTYISQANEVPEGLLEPIVAEDKHGNKRKIFLGATPSFPFAMTQESSDTPDPLLRIPMVKVSKESKDIAGFPGLRSGGRSALLYSKDSDKYFRLKGIVKYVCSFL